MTVRRWLIAAALSVFLALVSLNYLEEILQPGVEKVRTVLLGSQSYSQALKGCAGLDAEHRWIHPSTLALTVYGDAQTLLSARYGTHEPEVLPKYAHVSSSLADLKCVADFLLESAPEENIGSRTVRVMRFDINQSKYGLTPGWVSGLAQGFAGQVFLATYLLEQDEKYLNAAIEVGNLLRVPIDQGGVRVEISPGIYWYEEYAQMGRDPPLILNGHILALDFLYWMRQAEPDGPWGAMFESGNAALAARIGQYTGPYWSYYDSRRSLANRKYHNFHIRQLARYERHDPSGALRSARTTMQWQAAIPIGIFQRMFTQPSRMLLFLTCALALCYFSIAMIGYWIVARRRPGADTRLDPEEP